MGQLTLSPRPIAIVGTTSSGKSTLCNLLCGRLLLPTGVQETSTHIVDVLHDPTYLSPLLIVADLEQASVSEWQLSGDGVVRHELARLMANPGLPKHITVRLSLYAADNHWLDRGDVPDERCFPGLPLRYATPVSATYFLRDFPGLQHAGDRARIRSVEQFLDRNGIVVIVFNAEETDETKEQRLLRGVFEVMHTQQMPPTAALFVLNRKDAFERDDNPARSLEQRLAQIQRTLTQLMPDYWHARKALPALVACSTGELLVAEMVCWYRHLLEPVERKYMERQFVNAVERLVEAENEQIPDVRTWHAEAVWRGYCAIRRRSGIDHLLRQLRTMAWTTATTSTD